MEDHYRWSGSWDGKGKGLKGGSDDLHSWMVIFPFGTKQSSFHKDEVGFPWGSVGDNTNNDMSIEEYPSLFLSGIAFIVSIKVVIGVELAILSTGRNRIAFLVAVITAVLVIITVAVAVAFAIAFPGSITANVAAKIDRHNGLTVVPPLPVIATLTIGLVRFLPALRSCDDRRSRKSFARLIRIVEFDSGIKEGAWSTAKEYGGKYTSSHCDPLTLVGIRRIIEDPMGIEKEVEVIAANHRPFLWQFAETVLVDEEVHILHAGETSA